MSERLKVLLVLEATLGGTGRHILDLANGLLRRNHDVHLVHSAIRADAQFIAGLARLRRQWPAFLAEEIPMTRAVTLADFSSFFQLFRYLRRHGPFDIVHAHSTKAGFLARLTPGAGHAAMVYSPHGFMTMDPGLRGLARRAVSALERFLSLRSAAVVVVSDGERICAEEMSISARKIIRIENGVDTEALNDRRALRDQVRRTLGVPDGARCIGFVGRLSDKKEPLRLIEAFALVRQQASSPVTLVIVGSGDLEPAMRLRAVDLGLSPSIIWAGAVDGALQMCAFDVLAMCSRTEAFSYVLLEAIASGVPFVSTDVGAAWELARANCGLLCDSWSPQRFAALLLRSLEAPGLAEALSAAALQIAPELSVETMVNRICQLYARLTPHAAQRARSLTHTRTPL